MKGRSALKPLAMLAILGAVSIAGWRLADSAHKQRSASIAELAANMRSGAARLNEVWLRDGQPAAVALDGVVVPMLASGFPSSEHKDMANWVSGMAASAAWDQQFHGGPNSTTVGWYDAGRTGACWATYDGNTGNVRVDTSGC